ncbi:8046_t:CDS:2 [Ambispora leptoticha]|uniref:8046_t:CDS:1 n=1 Tax=Ambispora leptoticha TaxID=144679 RepID=A0A9N8VBU6_9GLOM|nr:8046_t:CDS:2 [Ambispora leptoticha]
MNNSTTSVSTSSVAKGNEFEAKVLKTLRNMNIDCQRVRELEAHRGRRLSGGDGGVDIFGNHDEYLILVQCKNYTTAKVGVGEIDAFEGVMSRYPRNTTIGIFISSAKDGYSRPAIARGELSKYNMLLTNMLDMCQDIPGYLSRKLKDDSVAEKSRKIEEIILALDQDQKRKIEALEEKIATM